MCCCERWLPATWPRLRHASSAAPAVPGLLASLLSVCTHQIFSLNQKHSQSLHNWRPQITSRGLIGSIGIFSTMSDQLPQVNLAARLSSICIAYLLLIFCVFINILWYVSLRCSNIFYLKKVDLMSSLSNFAMEDTKKRPFSFKIMTHSCYHIFNPW